MHNLISIFKQVIYIGATASILILIILLTKKTFKSALSPKWHYYIWILLMIKLIVPFSIESSVSVYSLLNTASDKINLHIREISIQNPVRRTKISNIVVENTINEETSAPDIISNGDTTLIQKKTPKYDSIVMIAALIWLIGVLVLSFYTIYLNIAFVVSIHKRYTFLEDKRINQILEDCKRVMKIKRDIPMFSSKKVRTPALYGFISTKILVSKNYMERLSDAEIKYIFLHELSHYRRKDILINWILTLLQIVYFFNPLVWYAFKKIHEDCEISCDAAALKYIKEEEHHTYGSTIIKLIKLYSESNFIAVTAGIAKNKSSYKRRIMMISGFRKSKWTNTVLALVLITFIGFIGLTGCKISEKNEPKNQTAVLSNSPNSTGDKNTTESLPVQQETSIQGNTGTNKQEQSTTHTDINSENGTKATDKSQNNATTEKATQSTTTKANENKEAFYGNWVIKKVLAYGSVGTYSREDAESLIGKNLNFSKEKANLFGDQASYVNQVAVNPVYKKKTLSKEDFSINYQMTLDKLGVAANSVTEVTVSDSKGFVNTFLIKDENTLVIVGGGTYFELVRK